MYFQEFYLDFKNIFFEISPHWLHHNLDKVPEMMKDKLEKKKDK